MPMTPLRAAAAAASLSLCAALGLGLAAQAARAPAAVQVTIRNFDFQPMAVSLPIGGEITWKNLDGEPHTVTSTDGSFRSEALDEGDSYSFRFTRPGVYTYICTIHPKMRATVTVR